MDPIDSHAASTDSRDQAKIKIIHELFREYSSSLLDDLARTFKIDPTELFLYYGIGDRCLHSQPVDADKNEPALDVGKQFTVDEHVFEPQPTILKHNHLPVRWIVPDCNYCKLHGNVLDGAKF